MYEETVMLAEVAPEIFRNRGVIILLNKMLEGTMEAATPVTDVVYGFRYPSVEELTGLPPSEVNENLEKLASLGVLTRTFYGKVFSCPVCNSSNLQYVLKCPHCGSPQISKNQVIEHLACGHFDWENKYRTERGLVCPHCHKELKQLDSDYAFRGVICTCESCHNRFDLPMQFLNCRECKKEFFITDAGWRDVYTYTLDRTKEEEIRRSTIDVSPLEKFFKELGLEVEVSGLVKGTSGVTHKFDLVLRPPGVSERPILVDVAVASDVVKYHLVAALIAKLVDVKDSVAMFVAVPKLDEHSRKLAASHRIHCVDGKNFEEVVERLRGEKDFAERLKAGKL